MLEYLMRIQLSDITSRVPFSYYWLLRKCFAGNIKTVLDLGCNDGRILEHIFANKIPKLIYTGVDLYDDYLEGARKKKIYKKLVKQDLTNKKWKEIDGNKYDLVFCSQVIEHFDKKDGECLLDKIEKLSTRRIVVATPNGFNYFDPLEDEIWNEYKSNLVQEHKSGWYISDFTKRGYKVYGQGLNIVYKQNSFIRHLPKFTHQFFFILSFILSPLNYFFPQVSFNLIAIKEK
jgi:2-polyprenyl-3-methyl-5-hydroxy-6-metoxy-1,4-benzoquinol methylase